MKLEGGGHELHRADWGEIIRTIVEHADAKERLLVSSGHRLGNRSPRPAPVKVAWGVTLVWLTECFKVVSL